jgi:hypothetical protein
MAGQGVPRECLPDPAVHGVAGDGRPERVPSTAAIDAPRLTPAAGVEPGNRSRRRLTGICRRAPTIRPPLPGRTFVTWNFSRRPVACSHPMNHLIV